MSGSPENESQVRGSTLAAIIDAAPWSGHQKRILFLACLCLVADGFDTQAIGFAAPAILSDFRMTKAALAPVFALGLAGMMIGAAVGGMIGDRIGRKLALVLSVTIFGLMTAVMATANDLFSLAAFRLAAGLGLGGALPNSAALVAELTPQRRRSFAVTMTILCIPIGGIVGGFVAAETLPQVGWRGLFVIAGVLPLAIGVLLFLFVPESPRFLLARGRGERSIQKSLSRMGLHVEPGINLVDESRGDQSMGSVGDLFEPRLKRDTVALWVAYFACLFATYMFYNWLPTLLAEAGYTLATASRGLLFVNVGAIVGALGGGWLFTVRGSRGPMMAIAASAVIGALVLVATPLRPEAPALILIVLTWAGGSVVGIQVLLFTLAANVYPTHIRATGVGSAAGLGRIGAVLSSFSGAAILGAVGPNGFFAVVALVMLIVALAIASVRTHIPRRL
jgi:AAHS family 4-hydroxybenzoate transporter-like MFS transporter